MRASRYELAVSWSIVTLLVYSVLQDLAPKAVLTGVSVLGTLWWYVVVSLAAGWLALRLGSTVGPVWATSSELSWLDVDTVVAQRRARLALTATLLAGVLSALVWVASTPSAPTTGHPTAVLLGVAVLTGWALALAAQHLHSTDLTRLTATLLGTAALVPALWRCHDPAGIAWLATAATYAGTVTAVRRGTLARHGHRLRTTHARPLPSRRLARWELARGGTLVEALQHSTATMDGTAVALVRQSEFHGTRTALRTPSADLLFLARLLTSPGVATGPLLLVLCRYAGQVWGRSLAVVLLVIVAYHFTWNAGACLRPLLEWPSLSRAFTPRRPLRRTPVLRSFLLLVAGFALLGYAVVPAHAAAWAAVALSAVLFLLRRVSAGRAGFSVGPLMASPMGPIPLGLIRRKAAGADVYVATVWLLSSASPGTAAVVLAVALAGYLAAVTARGR